MKNKKLFNIKLQAIKEANKRRKINDLKNKKLPKELYGKKTLEPTRYNDWENKGIISDF